MWLRRVSGAMQVGPRPGQSFSQRPGKTMNSVTFTIQSVHGLKDTFKVSPNGTVDTTKPQIQDLPSEESQPKLVEANASKSS